MLIKLFASGNAARRAGLKPVDWDGYMKYWKPSERFIKARQVQVANQLRELYDIPCPPEGFLKHDDAHNIAQESIKENEEHSALRHRQ